MPDNALRPMSGRTSSKGASRDSKRELQRFIVEQLLRQDPINLNFGGATAVYGPDAEAIAAGLCNSRCETDACSVVYQQLQTSFGP